MKNYLKSFRALSHLMVSMVLISLIMSFSACSSDPTLPKARVTVYENLHTDTSIIEIPVPNAKIWFNPPAAASQEDIVKHTRFPKLTDVRGQVTYEIAVEAMVDVLVEQEKDGKKRFGNGTLVFYFDSVYQEKIELKPW